MAQATVTLKLNTTEYDLLREAVDTAINHHQTQRADTTNDAKTRNHHGHRSAELGLLRSKL